MPTEERGVEAHGDGLFAGLVSARDLVLRQLDACQQRAGRRAEQLPQLGVGGILVEFCAIAREQPLEVGGDRGPLRRRSRYPPREQ